MKKVFLFIGALVLMVVVAVAAVLFFVDPNQFKPMIVEQTRKQTGLELVIEGDLAWSVFPSIGLSLGKTELKNPQGFKNENLLKIDSVGVDVSLLPLLNKELLIGNVSLNGAEVYLETLKDGRSNLDALTQKETTPAVVTDERAAEQTVIEQTASTEAEEPKAQEWVINLAGVTISDALLEIRNDQAGSYTKLYDVGLSVSEFVFDQWTTAIFAAKGKNNQQSFAAKGQAEFKLAQSLKEYALRNIQLESSFKDPATDITAAKLGLESFEFDKANKVTFSVLGNAAEMDIDLKGGSLLTVDKAISQVKMDNLTLDSIFKGDALPQSPMKVGMDSSLSFDLTKQHLAFVLKMLSLNKIMLDGKANVTLGDILKVRFSLHSPDIDVDEFLGLNKKADAATAETDVKEQQTAADQPEVEPDLSALKMLDVKGDIVIDKFKAANARMQNVDMTFSVNRGVAQLISFTSNLYEGSIKATARLDARKSPASYSAKKQIKGVKVFPLLKDVLQNEMLEGTGNIDVDAKGKSLTPTGIKQNLAGTVKINFADGAVHGVNVAQTIRTTYAKIKGQKVEENEEPQKTDFAVLTSTIKLNNGVAKTDDLNMLSPLLRIQGKGEANYIDETVNFLVKTSVVGSLEGQGGKSIDDLSDVTIPLRVKGSWTDPKFKLELEEVLKEKEVKRLKEKADKEKARLKKKAEKEAERGLKKLLGDDAKSEDAKELTDKLFKKLFN